MGVLSETLSLSKAFLEVYENECVLNCDEQANHLRNLLYPDDQFRVSRHDVQVIDCLHARRQFHLLVVDIVVDYMKDEGEPRYSESCVQVNKTVEGDEVEIVVLDSLAQENDRVVQGCSKHN